MGSGVYCLSTSEGSVQGLAVVDQGLLVHWCHVRSGSFGRKCSNTWFSSGSQCNVGCAV